MGQQKSAVRSIPLVLCAIIRGGKILLLKRKNPPYRGYWGMPGGKIKPGETVRQAALREGSEETSLPLEFLETKGTATENIRDDCGELEAHFIMFVALLNTDSDEFAECDEGELAWFDIHALLSEEIIPSDRIMLERFVFDAERQIPSHFEIMRSGNDFAVKNVEWV